MNEVRFKVVNHSNNETNTQRIKINPDASFFQIATDGTDFEVRYMDNDGKIIERERFAVQPHNKEQ